MAFVGSAGFDMNCIGMALKTSGGAGTALPAGIRVVGELNYEASEAATQTIQMTYLFRQHDCLWNPAHAVRQPVHRSERYEFKRLHRIHRTADYPAWALSCNTTQEIILPADLYRDEHGSGGDVLLGYFGGQGHIVNRLLRFDGRRDHETATGSQSGTSNITNAPSITPSTTNGLVLAIEQVGNGPTQLLASPTGSSAFYDCTYFTGATDAEAFCFGGGYAHYYNATTSAINWAWQMNNSPGGTSYNTSSIAARSGTGRFWSLRSLRYVILGATMKLRLLIPLLFLTPAWAATYTATSCSAAAFNAALSSATDGDTVQGPSGGGTATWAATDGLVQVTKGLTLNGNGCVINFTNVSASNNGVLALFPDLAAVLTVTGFTFNNGFTNGQYPVGINLPTTTPYAQPVRIYNVTFNTNGAGGTMLNTNGIGPYLIDHNTFNTNVDAAELMHLNGPGNDNVDVVPGSENMGIIENNTCVSSNPSSIYSQFEESFNGAAYVLAQPVDRMPA